MATWYFSDRTPFETTDTRSFGLAQEAATATAELPEHQQVEPHTSTDQDMQTSYGITYQRCGGGRRIIRRGHARNGGY